MFRSLLPTFEIFTMFLLLIFAYSLIGYQIFSENMGDFKDNPVYEEVKYSVKTLRDKTTSTTLTP